MRTPVFLAETVFSGPRQEQAAHHTGADAGPSQIAGADARSVRFADAETEDALERQADKLSEEPRSLFSQPQATSKCRGPGSRHGKSGAPLSRAEQRDPEASELEPPHRRRSRRNLGRSPTRTSEPSCCLWHGSRKQLGHH